MTFGAKKIIKEQLKMLMQHTFLPLVYRTGSKGSIEKGLVVFADMHNDSVPFSMKMMLAKVKRLDGKRIVVKCRDTQKMSVPAAFRWLVSFMRLYARAEYVFICDNFLPVASCTKREGTKVIQLWHSGGLLKKSGYDQKFSVPAYYKGNVFANYDLLTVSADCCVPVFTGMMRQPVGVVQATGLSRTDIYFSRRYNEKCRSEFFEKHPQARGKTVVLYAPTFRGSADSPYLVGEEDIDKAFAGDDRFFLVKKLHPHFERKHTQRAFEDTPCERLLPAADILVTDFSSVLFDWALYEKPFVIFAPDYDKYTREVGFYADIESFPTTVARRGDELVRAVIGELENRDKRELSLFKAYHMGACDGRATDRILKKINMI